jgi:hypothetical protein
LYASPCAFTPVINDGDIAANVPATNTIAKNIALVFLVDFNIFNI